MSRNSFDEGDDQITPLSRQFTQTDEGNRVLQMGNMAAARRKNSIHRISPPNGLTDHKNNNRNASPSNNRNASPSNNRNASPSKNRGREGEQIPSDLPARSKTTDVGMSRSKSMKKALGRAISTRDAPHVEHTIPNAGFAPSRSKSLRAPPPPRLNLRKQQQEASKKGGQEPVPVPDFPSPGRAPMGQRIFDPQTIAEDEGVDVERSGGWAVDKRTQKKLDDERARVEEQERQNVFSGDDGDMKHNKTGRQRSKSFKEFFKRG